MNADTYQRTYCDGFVATTITPGRSRLVDRQLDEVVDAARPTGQDRILEIGCGMGRFTHPLARRGYRIEGLDFSPVLLERFRSFEARPGAIPLHVGDVLDVPAHLHARFDVVLGFFVLHHLPDLERAFRSVARLLAPGGRAVFLDANGLNPLFYLQILLTPGMTWRGDKGMWQMRRGVLHGAMQRAGLQSLQLRRFGYLPRLVADRSWGMQLDGWLERCPLPDGSRAFQVVSGVRS